MRARERNEERKKEKEKKERLLKPLGMYSSIGVLNPWLRVFFFFNLRIFCCSLSLVVWCSKNPL